MSEEEVKSSTKILDRDHLIQVLSGIKKGLKAQDSLELKALSNQTIHCAACSQDIGSIAIAVMAYTLSKIIERNDMTRIKNWDKFVLRFNEFLDLAIDAAKSDNNEAFTSHLMRARKTLAGVSSNLKQYIEEILRKAAINKAAKFYEHGISLGQTAEMLGISTWEISEYLGQSKSNEHIPQTIEIKQRAKTALDFLTS